MRVLSQTLGIGSFTEEKIADPRAGQPDRARDFADARSLALGVDLDNSTDELGAKLDAAVLRPGEPAEKSAGYGSRWRKFRAAIVAERGPVCECCGADGVPLSLHHLDHRPPSSPRGFDPSNVKLACTSCHVRESRRRVA